MFEDALLAMAIFLGGAVFGVLCFIGLLIGVQRIIESEQPRDRTHPPGGDR